MDLFSILLSFVVLRQNVVGKYNFSVVAGGAVEGKVTLCKSNCLSPFVCVCALFVLVTSPVLHQKDNGIIKEGHRDERNCTCCMSLSSLFGDEVSSSQAVCRINYGNA